MFDEISRMVFLGIIGYRLHNVPPTFRKSIRFPSVTHTHKGKITVRWKLRNYAVLGCHSNELFSVTAVHKRELRYERVRSLLFQCIVSILWVFIMFWCGYVAYGMVWYVKRRSTINYLCVLFMGHELKCWPRRIIRLVVFGLQHNNKNKPIELLTLVLFDSCYMFRIYIWDHLQAVSSNTSLVIELC
jgi:hypothetical protein